MESKSQSIAHLIFFLLLCTISFLLGLIDLLLPTWISYCWWDFGLHPASTTSRIINFRGEETISEVHSDACGSLKEYVERSCPSACNTIDNLKSAGIVMYCFGALSLASLMFVICITVMRIFKYKVSPKFFWVALAPTVLWTVGFCSYAGTAGLGRLDPVHNKPEYNFKADDYEIKVGVAVAITVIFLNLGVAVYSWLKIKKFHYSILA